MQCAIDKLSMNKQGWVTSQLDALSYAAEHCSPARCRSSTGVDCLTPKVLLFIASGLNSPSFIAECTYFQNLGLSAAEITCASYDDLSSRVYFNLDQSFDLGRSPQGISHSSTCHKYFCSFLDVGLGFWNWKWFSEEVTHSSTSYKIVVSCYLLSDQGFYTGFNFHWSAVRVHRTASLYIVSTTPKFAHISPVLKAVHWLKIEQRIQYKVASLKYKVLQSEHPSSFHSLLNVQSFRTTRSSVIVTLQRPSVC